MPKLYEYLGLVVFFYSNEHEPIHVHARYGKRESKIEIVVKNGQCQSLNIKEVQGKQPLQKNQLKHFKHLVSVLADEIVQNWVNYFIYHKKIILKKIHGRIK